MNMGASRSSNPEVAATEESTPKPVSAVTSIASARQSPDSSQRAAERRAVLLERFANPSPLMREIDTAWEEALALYGDEDSDAWVSALEDGTHPLCRLGALARPA
jgi:hypothetical protein